MAATLGIMILLEGVHFDRKYLRELGFNKDLVARVLQSLVRDGVLAHPRRKYLLSEEYKQELKGVIAPHIPRGWFLSSPDAHVFDLCGYESWTEEEFEDYLDRLRNQRDACRRHKNSQPLRQSAQALRKS